VLTYISNSSIISGVQNLRVVSTGVVRRTDISVGTSFNTGRYLLLHEGLTHKT